MRKFVNTNLLLGVFLLASCTKEVAKKESPLAPPPISPLVNTKCDQFCGTIRACASKVGKGQLSSALCATARCETGDKCISKIDSPTGKFRGPFQFVPRTWNSECPRIFRRSHVKTCNFRGAIYDTCCSAICAAGLMSRKGGEKHWPVCGRALAEASELSRSR